MPEGEYGRHRGIYETEAESVAYVVAKYMGMDTGEYSIRYVAASNSTYSEVKWAAINFSTY